MPKLSVERAVGRFSGRREKVRGEQAKTRGERVIEVGQRGVSRAV
jgi:hypothetical protein